MLTRERILSLFIELDAELCQTGPLHEITPD
jgi:hypothetical protein